MGYLRLGTFNAHGANAATLSYIDSVINNFDFLLIQEHWLHKSKLHVFEDNVNGINCHGVSGMVESELHTGRPYGGCAILWRDTLSCQVVPVPCHNNRLCCIKAVFECYSVLIFSLYMPCDTEYNQSNADEYNQVLSDILSVVELEDADFVISGGDYNTDLRRSKSLHCSAMTSFIHDSGLKLITDPCIDYTYESMSNGSRSIIDHFIVTENLCEYIKTTSICHDINNISDHSILCISFDIAVTYVHTKVEHEARLMWNLASQRGS